MLHTSRFTFASSSFFAILSVGSLGLAGCAHPQTVTLTSAAVTPAAPASAPAAASAPVAAENEETAEPGDETEAEEAKAAPAPKHGDGPMTFEELSAALGDGQKMAIDLNGSSADAPAVKPLSADGYTAVGAAHQAVDTGSGARAAGDIKLSGGLTAAMVKAGVHDAAGRLRACYEHGLAANPRLAGRVMVSFEVDARGGVSSVDTTSDAIPADVRACVGAAFSSITFAMPKTAPAKIVYPVDFNKDS
jgi:hypothetical protein